MPRKIFLYFNSSILFCFFLLSCGNEVAPQKEQVNPKEYKQVLEKVNKYEVAKESDEINQYILHHNWQMEKTGTGLRYIIMEKGKGVQPKSGDIVYVNYKISLLDGTVCYSSEKDGVKDFKVEGDNIESGLHEAVLLMHVGDKAKFILPSYMANGLQGDNDKIPPMSAILVDLELLEVK
jgi:FKBP-type peptidyl-prolyl cis-trans isomerase FkpA